MGGERRPRAPFGRYAAFYDAIYRDKDYRGECRYLERLFARYRARPVRSILSLGCGTGNHDLLLTERGYRVTGVDRSAGMLARYREKAVALGIEPRVERADLRRARLGRRFDAVIAMFAVIGYQTSDRDLASALATGREHLRAGGLLVFDVWWGPAVLHDPPRERTRTIEEGGERIVRHSTCPLDEVAQVVRVRFRTERWSGGRRIERVQEEHPMRFFFGRELGLALAGAGLDPVALVPFGKLTGRPSESDWSVTVVARPAKRATRRRVARKRPK